MSTNRLTTLQKSKLNKLRIDCLELDCEQTLKCDSISIFSGSNDINFNNTILRNVSNPVLENDATTKIYVDNAISGASSGVTNPMTSNLDANNLNISSVADLSVDVISSNQSSTVLLNSDTIILDPNILSAQNFKTTNISNMNSNSSILFFNNIDMGNRTIENIITPINLSDAVNKSYVDNADFNLQFLINTNANNISSNALDIANLSNQQNINTSNIGSNANFINQNINNITTLQNNLINTNTNVTTNTNSINTNTNNISSNLSLINTKTSINDAVNNSTTETWSNNKIFIELANAGTPNYTSVQGSLVKVNLNTTNSQPTYGNVEVFFALSNLSAGQPVIFDYGLNGEISVKALTSINILNQQIAGINLNAVSVGFSARILVEGYCTVRRTTTNDIPPVGTPLYINPNDITRVSEFDTSNLSTGCIVAYNDYANDSVFVRVKRPQINKKIHNDISLIHEPNLYYQFLAYEKDGNDTYQIDYEGGATIATDVNNNKFFSFPTSNSLIVDNSFRTKASDITFAFYIKTWGSDGVNNSTTLLSGVEKFFNEVDADPRMPSIVYRLSGAVYSMIVTSFPRVGGSAAYSMPNARQNDVLVIISIEYLSANASQLRIYNSVDNDIVINIPWGSDRFTGDPDDIKAAVFGRQLSSGSTGLELYGLKVYNKSFTSLLEFQNVTKESFLLSDTPIYKQYNNAFINDNVSTGNTAYSSLYLDTRLQNAPQTFYYSFTRNTNNSTNGFYIDDYIQVGWDGFDEIFIRQPFTAFSNVYCQLLTNVGGSFPSTQTMILTTVNNDYYQNASVGNCHFLIQSEDDNTHPLYKILITLPATSGGTYMRIIVEKYIIIM